MKYLYQNLAHRSYLSERGFVPGSSYNCLRLIHNLYLQIGVKCYGSVECLSTIYIKCEFRGESSHSNGKLVMVIYVSNYFERILGWFYSCHQIELKSLNLLQTIQPTESMEDL